MSTHVHIRWLIRIDYPEVLQIEQSSFEYPWREEEFLRVLRSRNAIGMVAEEGERVVGFMVYELHRDMIRILNFAVAVDARRQSVGRQLIEKLVSKLSDHRRTRLETVVRETNLTAQLFFRAQGFRAVEVWNEHYKDTEEAAYVMMRGVTAAAPVVAGSEKR